MIKYSVQCQKGHGFEAWFQNSAAFDTQVKRGFVVCPDCGSIRVTKALMAPNVSAKTRRKGGAKSVAQAPRTASVGGEDAAVTAAPQRVTAPQGALPAELVDVLRKVRREVEAKADYVGPRFADEARKIHYDEAPARGIYGEASLDDVRALHEEGIDCLPLPVLPEDRN